MVSQWYWTTFFHLDVQGNDFEAGIGTSSQCVFAMKRQSMVGQATGVNIAPLLLYTALKFVRHHGLRPTRHQIFGIETARLHP